jgi:hypothetical protein
MLGLATDAAREESFGEPFGKVGEIESFILRGMLADLWTIL